MKSLGLSKKNALRPCIESLISFLEVELELLRQEELTELIKKGKNARSKLIQLYAEALEHHEFQVKPETHRLGYVLASDHGALFKLMRKDELNLYNELKKRLDYTNYVFANTNYDECNNGTFFRRS